MVLITGHHLAQLPVDARVGKLLLLACSLGCLAPALTIAACLSYKSPFSTSSDQQEAAQRMKLSLASQGGVHFDGNLTFTPVWPSLANVGYLVIPDVMLRSCQRPPGVPSSSGLKRRISVTENSRLRIMRVA